MRCASPCLIVAALAVLMNGAPHAGNAAAARPDAVVARGDSAHARGAGGALDASDPLAGWLDRHPEERARLGDHREDARLPDVSPAALVRLRNSLSHPRRPPPTAGDDARSSVDDRLLATHERAERVAFEAATGSGDAAWYTIRLRTALEVPLRAVAGSPCGRASRLAARLRAMPEFLRQATLNLSGRSTLPARRSRLGAELALRDLEILLQICRTALPEAFDDCRESRVQAGLAEADSTAVRALAGFQDFVRDDLLPGAEEVELPNLRAPDVAPDSAESASWLARLRHEIEAIETGPAVADTTAGKEPLGLAVADAELDSIRAVLKTRAMAAPGARDRVDLSARSPLPADIAPMPLAASGPWEAGVAEARLEMGGWPATGTGALARDPRRSRVALELCLAREGLPGRASWVFAEERQASRVRQALGLGAVRDAWARYAEALWIERGASPAEREALEVEHRRLEHERLARAALELMLRAEHMPLEQATAWIAEHAGLATEEARRAVLMASGRPSFAASTVALWGFEDLRADLEREMGPRFRLDAFHEAVMGAGAIPIVDLRAEVRAALLAPPRKR